MARPESISDIEVESIEFATVQLNKISTVPGLLKGYAMLLEQLLKSGATVDQNYSGTVFSRPPTEAELEEQLKSKQTSWDYAKKLYDQMAAVGEMEPSYMESTVKSWAAEEGLPYPPPHEPIDSFDAVIRDIDEVTA